MPPYPSPKNGQQTPGQPTQAEPPSVLPDAAAQPMPVAQQPAAGAAGYVPGPTTAPYPNGPIIGTAGPAEPSSSPYSFFLNQPQPAKKQLLTGENSMIGRLFIVLGGVVVLLIISAVVMSLLFSKPDNQEQLLAIARQQQEIIRISESGLKISNDDRLQQFAATTKLSVTTAHQELLDQIKKSGTKFDPKSLAGSKDPKTEEALKAAEIANTYDLTFTSIMQTNLTNHETTLAQAAAAASSTADQTILKEQQQDVQLLKKQLEAAQ